VKVLIVGSGAREHALAWKLSPSAELQELHCAPGNPGMASLASCHPVRAEDAEGMLGLARELDVDLAVIGPEAPLVAGLADHLRHGGIAVFGPIRASDLSASSTSPASAVHSAGARTCRCRCTARCSRCTRTDR